MDARALRPRLRALRADRDGTGAATAALVAAANVMGRERSRRERAAGSALAATVVLRCEGFALLPAAPISAEALGGLIQMIAGADFPPDPARVTALASAPRSATFAGVRLLAAGRLGPGLLIVREAAAMQAEIAAVPGAVWDRRFRLGQRAAPPPGSTLGALGGDAGRRGGARTCRPPCCARFRRYAAAESWLRCRISATRHPRHAPPRRSCSAHHARPPLRLFSLCERNRATTARSGMRDGVRSPML